MKRILDVFLSTLGILISTPVVIFALFFVWAYDRKNPIYLAKRVGLNGKIFQMCKIRSMFVNSDFNGINSTSENDSRITPPGKYVRRLKIDELTQLWNVLIGDMSLVGPRPNVLVETNEYTNQEKLLLTIKPGITDFASIVFADEGRILQNSTDPNLDYHQLIRPGKNKLALYYVANCSLKLDLIIIIFTLGTILSRRMGLRCVSTYLNVAKASPELIYISSRSTPLRPSPPPGSTTIITSKSLGNN